MRFIGFDREQEAITWARNQLGAKVPCFCRAVSSVDSSDEFVCVMVLSNFGSDNVDLHVASKRGSWITSQEFIRMYNFILHYVFDTLKALRATALIREDNTKARSFVSKLGFTQEGLMRKAFNGDNLCIYGILKEDFENHKWYRSL